MNYKQLNAKMRKIITAYPGIAGKLKLPNTVLLQFRKDESKTLTIHTLLKLVDGLGYNLDLEIKDANGNTVSEDELMKKFEVIAAPHKKAAKNTLATIAGVTVKKEAQPSTAKAETQAPKSVETFEMPEIDISAEETAKVAPQKEEEVAVQPETAKVAPEAPADKKVEEKPQQPAEVDIDLDDIFG